MKKIIFMGTPEFAVTILEGLLASPYEVVALVSQPDRPVGRKRVLAPPPVKDLAQAHGIPVFQPEKLTGSQEEAQLKALGADLIITAAYGQLVSQDLLDSLPYGGINVHASLLPKYRGAAPIHYALWQGELETGVSIMQMVQELDAGPVFSQRAVEISEQDDVGTLFDSLAQLGKDLLLETLDGVFSAGLEPQVQDPALASYAPAISRRQEQIDWQESARQIDRQVRAFRPFPSSYSWLGDRRVKIWRAQPKEEDLDQGTVGEIIQVTPQSFVVQCGNKSGLEVFEWQPAGKKRLPLAESLKSLQAQDLLGQVFQVRD